MKKKIAVLLAALVFALSACGHVVPITTETPPPSTPTAAPPTPTPTPAAEPTPEPTPEPVIDAAWWAENMPAIDGSTSLIPLEAGIRAALLDISLEEAEKQVIHTTTWGSFSALIHSKEADMILSVPLSETQLELAGEAGVELEQVPIAREGFVFVVNADNPVESLTQEQLRDIYSGKITNWSEVGGPDLPIIAYQRNINSGSQNYMIDFMGDVPLIDAPSELRPGSMSSVVDVVAVNDYAEQSIGYSVYSYAADMYANSDRIKFIAVDGIAPSKETMASGEYPLLSNNYAIFRSDEPENSPVRRLCAWMSSDEGQLAIAQSGYVTIRDVGFDYSQNTELPPPYSAVGCGAESWETSLFESLAVSEAIEQLPLEIILPREVHTSNTLEQLTPYTTGIEYSVNCLENKALEAEINAWLAQAVDEADTRSPELLEFLEKKTGSGYCQYYIVDDHIAGSRLAYHPSAVVSVTARNGYLWAVVAQVYINRAGSEFYYHSDSRTWDMFSGKIVTTEELFRDGLDIDEYLNSFLLQASQSAADSFGTLPSMKHDFIYLPADDWTVTPDAIYINQDNPYFTDGICFSLGGDSGIFCSEIYRDMSGMFTESVTCIDTLHYMGHSPRYTFVHDGFYSVALLDESIGNSEARAKINADVLRHTEAVSMEAAQQFLLENGFEELGNSVDSIRQLAENDGWSLAEYGDRLAVFTASAMLFYDNNNNSILWPDSQICLLYDLQTGERLDWQDILVDNWLELADISAAGGEYEGGAESLPPLCNLYTSLYPWDIDKPLRLYMYYPDNYETEPCTIKLPVSALKWYGEIS